MTLREEIAALGNPRDDTQVFIGRDDVLGVIDRHEAARTGTMRSHCDNPKPSEERPAREHVASLRAQMPREDDRYAVVCAGQAIVEAIDALAAAIGEKGA
jgi:hypothetical protein